MYAELIGNYKSHRIKSRWDNTLDITHTIDGVRYFCINRTLKAEVEIPKPKKDPFLDVTEDNDYESFMTGGEITESYLNYA